MTEKTAKSHGPRHGTDQASSIALSSQRNTELALIQSESHGAALKGEIVPAAGALGTTDSKYRLYMV